MRLKAIFPFVPVSSQLVSMARMGLPGRGFRNVYFRRINNFGDFLDPNRSESSSNLREAQLNMVYR